MKRQLIIFIVIGIGIISSWIFVLFMPARQENTKLNQEIKLAEQTVVQFRQDIAQLPQILKARENFTKEEREQAQYLFTSKQVIGLLKIIEHKCDSFKLNIQEVRPPVEELILLHQTLNTSTQPQFLNITLVLGGSFAKFGQFVIELEKAPFFKSVNYSRLQSATVSNAQSQFLIEFKVLLGRAADVRLAGIQ